MPQQAFDIDCMYCRKKFHCPAEDVGQRIRCPACGSAMMADPARKSDEAIEIPEVKTEEYDDTDL